jgi:hypothetical protein
MSCVQLQQHEVHTAQQPSPRAAPALLPEARQNKCQPPPEHVLHPTTPATGSLGWTTATHQFVSCQHLLHGEAARDIDEQKRVTTSPSARTDMRQFGTHMPSPNKERTAMLNGSSGGGRCNQLALQRPVHQVHACGQLEAWVRNRSCHRFPRRQAPAPQMHVMLQHRAILSRAVSTCTKSVGPPAGFAALLTPWRAGLVAPEHAALLTASGLPASCGWTGSPGQRPAGVQQWGSCGGRAGGRRGPRPR